MRIVQIVLTTLSISLLAGTSVQAEDIAEAIERIARVLPELS